MTKQEITQALSDQNWEAIRKVPWWEVKDCLHQSSFVINKEFVTKFLIDTQGVTQHILFYDTNWLINKMVTDNMRLSYHDYDALLIAAKKTNPLANLLLPTREKDQEYLRFFLKNQYDIYSIFLKYHNPKTPVFHITNTLLGDGSLNTKLKEVLSSSPQLAVECHSRMVLQADKFGLDFLETVDRDTLLAFITNFKVVQNDIIKTATSKYTSIELAYTLLSNSRISANSTLEHLVAIDYTFTDEALEEMLPRWENTELLDLLSSVCTIDQLKKYKDIFGINRVLSNPKIALKDVADMFPGKQGRAYNKFYTEEEIVKYPQFFEPVGTYNASYLYKLYYTKKTQRVLNKEWGTRTRHDTNNQNVTHILLRNSDRLTPDIIRYLSSKGSIDWRHSYNHLKSMAESEDTQPQLRTVLQFLVKYDV